MNYNIFELLIVVLFSFSAGFIVASFGKVKEEDDNFICSVCGEKRISWSGICTICSSFNSIKPTKSMMLKMKRKGVKR